MPVIVVTLAGSGFSPLSVSFCLMKVTEEDLNPSFLAERRKSHLLMINVFLFLCVATPIDAIVISNVDYSA